MLNVNQNCWYYLNISWPYLTIQFGLNVAFSHILKHRFIQVAHGKARLSCSSFQALRSMGPSSHRGYLRLRSKAQWGGSVDSNTAYAGQQNMTFYEIMGRIISDCPFNSVFVCSPLPSCIGDRNWHGLAVALSGQEPGQLPAVRAIASEKAILSK